MLKIIVMQTVLMFFFWRGRGKFAVYIFTYSEALYISVLHNTTYFDVLLTVHLSIFISVFNQLATQNLFYFKPLHVSSICAHHPEVKIIVSNFDVLLTVLHRSIFISVFNQLDAQNLFHNKFYFMPLHVSSTCAHHHTYRCDDTRGCIMQSRKCVISVVCVKLGKGM